jgi:hypothetical protein
MHRTAAALIALALLAGCADAPLSPGDPGRAEGQGRHAMPLRRQSLDGESVALQVQRPAPRRQVTDVSPRR